MIRRSVFWAASVCLVVVLAACGRSPRVTFYTLTAGFKPAVTAADTVNPSFAIGPITLPEVVDRPQLVVRVAANRVDILETQRWAEPLKSEIPRLVAENLRGLLRSDRISSYHQNTGVEPDYRVLLDIVRFESSPGEAVTIEAVWSIRQVAGGALKTGRSQVREPVDAVGYDPLVAAYGRALLAVSRDLAGAIRGVTGMSN